MVGGVETVRFLLPGTYGHGPRRISQPPSAAADGSALGAAPAIGVGGRHGHGHGLRSPVTVSDQNAAEYLVLRGTGLPSRSALVAPPFRLAALRWRATFVLLG
jgi:hypothetical protein